MTPDDFEFLAKILKQNSGIFLTPDKQYLLDTRLQPLARKHGLKDIHEYVKMFRSKQHDKALIRELTEAMTTNESMFFRDNKPFQILKETLLPAIVERNKATKKIRIWNAACSNGQEPYSVLMTLLEEKAKMPNFTYEIIGTDIDTQVLEKAKSGIYTQFEVQRGMPIQLLLKYFVQHDGNNWKIKDELRKMVKFKYLNLLDSFSLMGKFDIIFIRNVLIYFDTETKKDILERLIGCLNKGGYIILGSAETVIGITDKLKQLPNNRGIFVAADDETHNDA